MPTAQRTSHPCFSAAILVLMGTLLAMVRLPAQAPRLDAKRTSTGVELTWTDVAPGYVLEEASTLPVQEWRVVPIAPAGTDVSIQRSAATDTRFYRLRDLPSVPLAQVEATSPTDGEPGVSVNREVVLDFSLPLAPDAMITRTNFFAGFSGRNFLSRVELSSDRRKATLFFLEPVPGATRINVAFDATGLRDVFGRTLDGDGDGQPGGYRVLRYDTFGFTPVAGTAVIGHVFASEPAPGPNPANVPLAGVTISVDGAEETLRTTTDASGFFRLTNAPAGRFFVHVDGRTAPASHWPDGSYYPFVGKAWNVAAGRDDNRAGGSGVIYLPLIPANTLQAVSTTTDTPVRFSPTILAAHPELTGVQILVPANSLFSDNGARGGRVGIAPVPPDRLPEPLPAGLSFPLVITVQTDGPSNFDTPAPIRFPNLPDRITGEKLPPGAKSGLWSFNHDTGAWALAGSGTVSEDGRFIDTDPGVGIRQPGWHGFCDCTHPHGNDGPPPGPPPPPPCDAGTDSAGQARIGRSGARPAAGEDCQPCPDDPQKIQQERARCILSGGMDFVNNCLLRAIACKLGCRLTLNTVARLACERICAASGAECRKKFDDARQCREHWDNCLANLGGDSAARLAAVPVLTDPPELIRFEALTREVGDLYVAESTLAAEAFALIGDATNEDQLSPAQLAQVRAIDAQITALFGGQPADEFFRDRLDEISRLAEHLQQVLNQPSTEAAFFVYRDLDTGAIQRGKTSIGGGIDCIIAGSKHTGELMKYAPGSGAYSVQRFYTGTAGTRPQIPPASWTPDNSPDSDGDGLSDNVEFVLGTNPNNPDSDGDGVSDGAEVALGQNPLDGRPTVTGVIGTVPAPGTAWDVAAFNQVAALALGDAGVAILDVHDIQSPVLAAVVDTPGDARAVALGGGYLAVADGSSGVRVLDIRSPASPRLVGVVTLGSPARAVAATFDTAFAGLADGQVIALDLATGQVLTRTSAGEKVDDLIVAGDFLYVATPSRLVAFQLDGSKLDFAGQLSGAYPYQVESITGRRRIAVVDGLAYVSSYPGYSTFAVTNPAAMHLVGTAVDYAPNSFKQIVPTGSGFGLAAVGVVPSNPNPRTHNVQLFSLRDPSRTSDHLTEYPTPGLASAVAIYNGLGYVADGRAGLQVLNYLAADTGTQPPTIRLTTSLPELSLETGKPLRLTAQVTDDVQVRNVEFHLDGQLLATDGNAPFEIRFIAPPRTDTRTNFIVRARAFDTGGNSAWSESLVITLTPDATPPVATPWLPQPNGAGGDIQSVSVRFNEPVDPGSVTARFSVTTSGSDGTTVPGTVSLRDDNRAAILVFSQPLAAGRYRASLRAGYRDPAGNAATGDLEWGFLAIAGKDTDQDGLTDEFEIRFGYDPNNPDSNGNGVPDGLDDDDGDGVPNYIEMLLGTDPHNPFTFPPTRDNLLDRDGDYLTDMQEARIGTDWLNPDTDGDLFTDEAEITAGTNPLDRHSYPLGVRFAPPLDALNRRLAGPGGVVAGVTTPPVGDRFAPGRGGTFLGEPPVEVFHTRRPDAQLPFAFGEPPVEVFHTRRPDGQLPFAFGEPPVEVLFEPIP